MSFWIWSILKKRIVIQFHTFLQCTGLCCAWIGPQHSLGGRQALNFDNQPSGDFFKVTQYMATTDQSCSMSSLPGIWAITTWWIAVFTCFRYQKLWLNSSVSDLQMMSDYKRTSTVQLIPNNSPFPPIHLRYESFSIFIFLTMSFSCSKASEFGSPIRFKLFSGSW